MKTASMAIPLLLAICLAVLSACGGGGGGGPTATPLPTAATALTPTLVTPTPPARLTPSGTVTATGTPVPTGTPTSQQPVDAAFAAALEWFDAVSDADCQTNNPQKKHCVEALSEPFTVQRGIAAFGVADPEGVGGFVGVLGRDPAGEWKSWFGGQQAYQLLTLPGDMLVCAEGERLNVRSAPTTDAPAVGQLDDLTTVRAEEFVLTEPASDLYTPGYGWYHLSSPQDGWAYSKYLTDARNGDCTLRDALEAP